MSKLERKSISNSSSKTSVRMTIRDLFHQFRYFDWFGNMTNFHMKGSTNYQTKIGALFSLAWLTIILSAYVFYFNRLMSRDDPAVGFNKYIGDK